jgi:hypothetical protein
MSTWTGSAAAGAAAFFAAAFLAGLGESVAVPTSGAASSTVGAAAFFAAAFFTGLGSSGCSGRVRPSRSARRRRRSACASMSVDE